MKKNIPLLVILVVVAIIAVSYIILQKGQSEPQLTAQCTTDSDCKLIYSNCDCEAVPVGDPRTFLESNEICKWNICRGTNVTAVCRNNKCVRSDQ